MLNNKPLVHSIHHFLAGALLILKAVDKISQDKVAVGLLFLFFGIIILVYFIYILITGTEPRGLNITIHLFEGIAALFTAYIFYKDGATYLPYVFLLAALGFFISVYVTMSKKKKLHSTGVP